MQRRQLEKKRTDCDAGLEEIRSDQAAKKLSAIPEVLRVTPL